MGWHYILRVTCKVLPEFQEFVEKKYLCLFSDVQDGYTSRDDTGYTETASQSSEDSYEAEQRKEQENAYRDCSKAYKDLIDIWTDLQIGHHFQEYKLQGSTWTFRLSKKVNWHNGDLKQDYESFLKDLVAPITSEISSCEIESDDFGDQKWRYSDSELRNVTFNLRDQIKYVEHTYNHDHTEILETRIVYKRSIKALQTLDLERAYKGW
jgi:hypothetical protein